METSAGVQRLAHYFEKVLGVRVFAGPRVDGPQPEPHPSPHLQNHQGLCLLVEVGSASSNRESLKKMGTRLMEALRNEWLKKSVDALPELQWCQASEGDWAGALSDAGADLRLAIVCGATANPIGASASSESILHVPSFLEMDSSPSLKREAWQAIQKAIQIRSEQKI